MGKQIKAEIVADSIDNKNNRITSFLLTYPRFIHGEVMTHRMFSRNSASSRAIPFDKMVKMVEEDPFIPIAWQKDHKGMQGTEYIQNEYKDYHKNPGDNDLDKCIEEWLYARNGAVLSAKKLDELGVTKQLCNRLLEPFMWHTVLVTATEYDNFFELRCPKYQYYDMVTGNEKFFRSKKDWLEYHDNKVLPKGLHISKVPEELIEWLYIDKSGAEIHIQALAEVMWDAMNESTPKQLQAGEWHIPFGNKIYSENGIEEVLYNHTKEGWVNAEGHDLELDKIAIQIATARCARLSYMTFDGEINYEKDIKLHDQLLESKHASPMEHMAQCINDSNWYSNFKGWKQYRKILEENGSL